MKLNTQSHLNPRVRVGVSALIVAATLVGCEGTAPTLGGAKGTVTGAAGGASAEGENTKLDRCDESLGTLAVQEDQSASWWHVYSRRYPQLGSTIPVLRLMIQQSNCFVVVERGRAMANVMQERSLERSGEARTGSNFGQGQMVAADYTMSPSIQFSAKGTGGASGVLGGGILGAAAGFVAGSMKSNEASTTLLLIDNRSSVQISAAEGSAKNFDFGVLGGAWGGGVGGGAGGFSKTPEGKIITAAFADSYNQMVKALRNYKAQTVRGGLGTGGRLGVQGGSTEASKEITAPAAKPAAKKSVKK